jgi:hypothetical protein
MGRAAPICDGELTAVVDHHHARAAAARRASRPAGCSCDGSRIFVAPRLRFQPSGRRGMLDRARW